MSKRFSEELITGMSENILLSSGRKVAFCQFLDEFNTECFYIKKQNKTPHENKAPFLCFGSLPATVA